jgi:excinuclease ABC subunit C
MLKEKAKKLPSSPGIYLMKDSHNQIIYVGKAKNLKRRVQSYFQNKKNHSPKTIKLVKMIKDFDYILTDTELEALLLECQYIQELKPFYNRLMKNPKAYTYITIRQHTDLQTIETANDLNGRESLLYFGPYTNKNTVIRAIQGIKDYYKINCQHPDSKNTPCLNYSLGLCIGLCIEDSATAEYQHILQKVIALFDGTNTAVLEEINTSMMEASQRFNFEKAAQYRDYLHSIRSLLNQEKAIEFTEGSYNIMILEPLNTNEHKLLLIKGTRILYNEKLHLSISNIHKAAQNIRNRILTYFQNDLPSPTMKVSKDELDHAKIIYHYLKNHHYNHLIIPHDWLHTPDYENIDCHLIDFLTHFK